MRRAAAIGLICLLVWLCAEFGGGRVSQNAQENSARSADGPYTVSECADGGAAIEFFAESGLRIFSQRYPDPNKVHIEKLNEGLYKVLHSTGSNSEHTVFVDTGEGKVSEVYFNLLHSDEKLVAFMEDGCIYLTDMFDRENVHMKIIRDFYKAAVEQAAITSFDMHDGRIWFSYIEKDGINEKNEGVDLAYGAADVRRMEEYTTMKFKHFGAESSEEVFEFMENPWDNYLSSPEGGFTQVFRFRGENGKLILHDMGQEGSDSNPVGGIAFYDLSDRYSASEYCSKAVAFLCDDEAILRSFGQSGISDVQKIVRITTRHGFVVAGLTDKEAYYMTVPLQAEVYGDYVFQKVHTKDEFEKIYGPRPVKIFVNQKEAHFPTAPMMIAEPQGIGEAYYFKVDVLELADALGIPAEYDKAANTVTFGEHLLRFVMDEDGGTDVYITEPGKEEEYTYRGAQFGERSYIIGYSLTRWLCRCVGYELEMDIENYALYIDSVPPAS